MLLVVLLTGTVPLHAGQTKEIRIVTTTTTLAAMTQELTHGIPVEIHSVASGKRDIHFISPTPKDVLKIKKAEVFIHLGLDLEAWRNPLLNAAGNTDFLGEGKRAIDVSAGIGLLEIPTDVSRAGGDIHLFGNPHYWLDPEAGLKIAENIVQGLITLYPESRALLEANLQDFQNSLKSKIEGWQKRMLPFKGTKVLTYHRSWSYFAERFGLTIRGELEPKAGIPPTAKHIAYLIGLVRAENIPVILKESYYENRTPQKISKEASAAILTFVQAVDELKGIATYADIFEHNISEFETAMLKRSQVTA